MIKQEEKLKQLAESDFGLVLIEFLDDQIEQMGDISKIKTFEELVGKQEAVKILKELFGFLEKVREKRPTIQRTDYK